MRSFTTRNRLSIAVAILVPASLSVWLMAHGDSMALSINAVLAALTTAMTAISLDTWRTSQVTAAAGH
jgi:ABC-type transport system involved in cytochrome c biogenesis permease subunit